VVVTAFCHSAKLLVPAIARTRGGANDELIALHGDFYFVAKPNLVNEQLGDANAPRVADFDNRRFYASDGPGCQCVVAAQCSAAK